jgi:hypothetical protein
MSNRLYNLSNTQGIAHVQHGLTIIGQGTSTPTLSEGDPKGVYFSVGRSGVGTYSLTTLDPFLAVVCVQLEIASATATNSWTVTCGLPSQNANGTWSVGFCTFLAGVKTDVAANDFIFALVVMRNSIEQP